MYGVGLLALELHRLWLRRNEPWAPRLAEFVATGIPFVPLIVLLVASPTWNTPGSPAFWEFSGKLQGLVAVFNVYYLPVAGFLLAAATAGAVYAFRRGILKFNPAGWAILAVGCIAYLALPRALFGAHLADQRLPIAIVFMLVACFDVDLRDRAIRHGFMALVAALLVVRVAEVQLVWNHLDRGTKEFFQSVEKIKRGARVLVVYGDRSTGKEISDFNLVHAASMAVIERSALVSTEFTVKGKQPDDGILASEDEQGGTDERRGWRVDRKGHVLVQPIQKVLVTPVDAGEECLETIVDAGILHDHRTNEGCGPLVSELGLYPIDKRRVRLESDRIGMHVVCLIGVDDRHDLEEPVEHGAATGKHCAREVRTGGMSRQEKSLVGNDPIDNVEHDPEHIVVRGDPRLTSGQATAR